jgi:hypothetical protein
MAGCSAREADKLVLTLYAKIEDSQRGGQKGYLREGDCSVNKDEILKHEVQPEHQHKVNIPEYDEMCIILCFCLCVLYQQTFCSSSPQIYAEDTKSVWPNELGEGIKTYIKLNTLKHVNEFMCTYVQQIAHVATWNKRMTNEPNRPFFCYVTPSDIVYILSLSKNGKDMWDQTKKRKENPEARHEKRAKPLFSTGEGKRRESGKTVWNNDGLEFFYTAERNWTEVYNSKEQFSALINGWEIWEPNDKTKKDPIRTKKGRTR